MVEKNKITAVMNEQGYFYLLHSEDKELPKELSIQKFTSARDAGIGIEKYFAALEKKEDK